MNIQRLYELQAQLDQAISEKIGVEVSHYMVPERLLALTVEVGEFANELANFKYWKKSHTINREKVLEEGVDCLHFLLSIGNTLDIKIMRVGYVAPDYNLINEFLNLYQYISELHKAVKYKDKNVMTLAYISVFKTLIHILLALDFTPIEIEGAYIEKHRVNYQRIANNY